MTQKTNRYALMEEARRQDVSVLTVIKRALEKTDGNVKKAAKLLGVTPQAVYLHIQKSGATFRRELVK